MHRAGERGEVYATVLEEDGQYKLGDCGAMVACTLENINGRTFPTDCYRLGIATTGARWSRLPQDEHRRNIQTRPTRRANRSGARRPQIRCGEPALDSPALGGDPSLRQLSEGRVAGAR